VLERLERRVADALAPGPPPRRPSRPSRAARERRLADKARRASVKAARRPPAADAEA
jgi:ribosome-associated protein